VNSQKFACTILHITPPESREDGLRAHPPRRPGSLHVVVVHKGSGTRISPDPIKYPDFGEYSFFEVG
jgi:hypothetical protein